MRLSKKTPRQNIANRAQSGWRLPRTFDALHNYNYRLFLSGQLVSLIGTWMQTVGLGWLVLTLTRTSSANAIVDSSIALGTVTVLQFLPVLLLTLFAGVFVDRLPKRRLLIFTQSGSLLQALALAVLVSTGSVQLWHVYVLALILGTINAIDVPTRQAFVIEMVGRDHIVNAVNLNSTLFNVARIVGPAIGGLLIAAVGLAECFYLNAFSYLFPIIALLLMREELLKTPDRRPAGRVLTQLVEGLSYVVRTPAVMLVVILMGVLGTFGFNFTVMLPLLARYVLGLGADGYGALFSVMGIGSLLAALVLATTHRTSVRQVFLGAAAFTLLLAALAVSRVYSVSLILLIPLGFAQITFATSVNTFLQLAVPDNLRGRVLSLYTLLFLGSTPIGGLVTGVLAARVGVQWTLGIEALICMAGLIAAVVYGKSVRKARNASSA